MRKLYMLLSVLCLLWTQNASAQRIPRKWDEPPINGVSQAWLRQFYFYKQRVLPNNDLPPNFWLDARRQAEQLPVVEPNVPQFGIQSFTGWESMGPTSTNNGWLGRVNAIVVDRTTPTTVYIGVAKGGVWKSIDSGTTWVNLTDTITQYVGCLTQDPVNANTLYMGTGEEYYAVNTLAGIGIYKSIDGGATWTLKGNATFAGIRINQIVIDPTNTNKWVVSCDAGIYTTTDGGTTFTQRLAGLASALRLHPTNAQILYAALGYPFGATASNGVYKSTNGGVNWTKLAGGLPASNTMGRIELDIHKANPNIVYVAVGSLPGLGYTLAYIGRTTDGGATWTSLPLPAIAGGSNRDTWYNFMLRADPVSAATAYVGLVEIYRTINAGAGNTWTNVTPNHPDMHTLEFDPNNPSNIYLGQDAGLFYSTNQGGSWTHKNTGRATMEYYAFDVHPTDPSKLAAGAQDNSTHVRTATDAFNVVIGGDGFWTAYKKSDPNIMLGEFQFGNMYRSTNGGAAWSFTFTVPNGSWSTPIVNDPTTPERFYAGGTAVFRSINSGASWSASSGVLDGTSITRILVAPAVSNYVYAGTEGGGLFATSNAGASWVNRSAGLPAGVPIGAIAVHPTIADIVYVGHSGNTANRVRKSINGGATWTNYMGNLPNAPVNGLVVNPVNPVQVLAATDVGVFLTNDGVTWARYGSGFPNTPCTHLVANAATGYLTVSTFGRGMWRILLPGNNPVPILTSITPNSAAQSSAAFTLTVNGDDFIPTSQVRWNGVNRTTTYVSVNQLTATIPATDLTTAGTANVTVFNPAPFGGTSAARTFTVTGGTAAFSGDTTGALTYNRTNEGQPPTSVANPNGTAVPYTVFKVTVPTTGSYDFEIACGYDAFTTLYSTDFNPNAPLTNALVANDDKGGTTARSGFDGVALTAGTTYLLVVSGYVNTSVGTFNGTISGSGAATITPLHFITGTVTLQGLLAAGYPQSLTFQLRPTIGANINRTIPVGSNGVYAVINLLPDTYNMAVKGSRWLRRTTSRNVSANSITAADITLRGGDANNDNAVDIGDLTILIAAYNKTSPNAGYNLAADFNGDGANDIADLLIAIGNYNVIGNL